MIEKADLCSPQTIHIFILVQTPEAQGREDSLSPDTTFQSETHLFLPDKISGNQITAAILPQIREASHTENRTMSLFAQNPPERRRQEAGALKSTGWHITGFCEILQVLGVIRFIFDSQIRKSYICMLMWQPGPGISGGASV